MARKSVVAAARLAPLLLAITAVAGCKENAMVKNYETDNNFLRVPGQPDPTLPKSHGPLFPLTKGSRWTYDVHLVNTTGQTIGTELGALAVTGSTKIAGTDGMIVETSINGRPVKDDVYSARPAGIYLLATGKPGSLTSMSPPILILGSPLIEGEQHSWTGLLHYAASSGFGNALSRVSGHTKMPTSDGAFDAYRLDFLISTTINGTNQSIPITRWVAPGVGVVNQRELDGSNTEIWSLKSHVVTTN